MRKPVRTPIFIIEDLGQNTFDFIIVRAPSQKVLSSVSPKYVCSATEACYRLEISDEERSGIIYSASINALIKMDDEHPYYSDRFKAGLPMTRLILSKNR